MSQLEATSSWKDHWRANPDVGAVFHLKRAWFLGMETVGFISYSYYLNKYRMDLPVFQRNALIAAASGYVLREFISFFYTSPNKSVQTKDLLLVVIGNIIYLLPAYFAVSSNKFSKTTNAIINYSSLAFQITGHLFNTFSEIQRKWFLDKAENKGKVFMNGLFSITRHPNCMFTSSIQYSFAPLCFCRFWRFVFHHWMASAITQSRSNDHASNTIEWILY